MTTEAMGVVFVNYHSEALILPRARMLAGAGMAVVVADNSGTFPAGDVPVIDMGGNRGFGAGCNRGVEGLPEGVTTLCFHNPDVDATPAAIEELTDRLGAQPRPGIVAPALRTDGQLRPSGFRYPSPARELALAARAAWGLRRTAGGGASSDPAPRTGGRRFGSAALVVASRTAFEAVGGFDESFFLYAEDLDLWHRLQAGGWSAGFAPDVVVSAQRKAGSPASAVRRELLRWLGVELFAERNHEGWRRLRAAHLPFLWALAGAEPDLARCLRSGYRRWRPPSEVMVSVRALLSTT